MFIYYFSWSTLSTQFGFEAQVYLLFLGFFLSDLYFQHLYKIQPHLLFNFTFHITFILLTYFHYKLLLSKFEMTNPTLDLILSPLPSKRKPRNQTQRINLCHLKFTHSHWKGPGNKHFTTTLSHVCEASPSILKISVITCSVGQTFIAGTCHLVEKHK
jgi:hypothetical protein